MDMDMDVDLDVDLDLVVDTDVVAVVHLDAAACGTQRGPPDLISTHLRPPTASVHCDAPT